MPSFSSPETLSSDMQALVKGNTAFALDLYSLLKEEKGNLFFSPYSISAVLAMTYAGARGDTEKQMAEALHFTLGQKRTHPSFAELTRELEEIQKKGAVQLLIANSLWPQKGYPFLPEYISLIKRCYGVSVTPMDYKNAAEKARVIINKWVEDKTREKIKDIISPGALDLSTRLVLVNAIYFKGDWANQFDSNRTADADFILPGGRKKQVPMMYQKEKFGYKDLQTAQLLELPYADESLSMIIVLPKEVNGLTDLEKQLSIENLDSWLAHIPREQVKVYLPKFKMTWGTFELNEPLKRLGMQDAFWGDRADFSGMDGTKYLYISMVLHKAFIEVNEEGTEAAAASAVIMTLGSAEPRPKIPVFRADHPFLFIIRDNVTGSILFLGRVVNPEIQDE